MADAQTSSSDPGAAGATGAATPATTEQQGQQQAASGVQTALNAPDTATPAQTPADFPADWRDKLAGEDEKAKQRLGRFASPADLFKSYRELEAKMSSGQVKAVLPKDAAPEDVARWRTDNGIPEKIEGYYDKLPQGALATDEDKAMAGPVLEAMHARHASPEVVSAMLEGWATVRDNIVAERAEADATAKAATEDELRGEWGADYRRNINVIKGWLDTAPADVKDGLMNGRLGDGTPIMSNPEALSFLFSAAMQANPAATVVPGAPGASADTVDSEIDKIEKTMRENRAEYNRDPKMQQRYLKLIEARESLKKGRAA